MDQKFCFNCKSAESDIPVVNMRFKGKELWICPRCIPSLIHEPQIVQEKLDATDQS